MTSHGKPAITAALQALLDREAIHDVLLRYARGVDRKDLDLVASCFTPDAAYEGALGTDTVATALASLRDAMARYEGTLHFIGNQLIELSGDSARSETYAIAYHRLSIDGAASLFTVGVRYLDDLARHAERWLIHRRVVKTEWQRTEALGSSPGPNP